MYFFWFKRELFDAEQQSFIFKITMRIKGRIGILTCPAFQAVAFFVLFSAGQ